MTRAPITALLVAAALSVWGLGFANASVNATGKTRTEIVKKAKAYALTHSAYRAITVRSAKISTVSRRWAAVRVAGPDGNTATVLLKRTGHWRVHGLGTAFSCSQAPRKVLEDLVGFCLD